MTIYELLKKGKENATPADYLMMQTGLSRRQVFKEIERERCENGRPILPDRKGGYYIADVETAAGRHDVVENIRRLENMGKSNLKAAAALKRAVSQTFGQTALNFGKEGRKGGGYGRN